MITELTRKFNFWLTVIFLLAVVVRFLFLNTFPPLLLQDEANIGFNAVSIAETGKDEWGNRFPLTFFSFGDNKPPVYFYLTAIVYLIIGWSPVLPRIVSAAAGVLSVVLIALWLKKGLKSETTALLASLILALSPWGIHLSRMALESNLALTFFIGGLTSFTYAQGKNRLNWLMLAGLCFALSGYTYIAYRFVTGVLLIAYALVTFIQKKSWQSIKLKTVTTNSVLILIITGALLVPSVLITGNLTRYNQTALVRDESIAQQLFYNRGTCHLLSYQINLPIVSSVCKLFWNTSTLPFQIIGGNLVSHLSPNFLFFTGDTTFNRNPAAEGMFFWYLLPFYFIGIAIAIKNFKSHLLIFLGWFISMIPSVLTGEPHLIRMSVHLPFVIFFMALGIQWMLPKVPKVKVVLPILLLLGCLLFFLNYTVAVFAKSEQYHSYSREVATTAYNYWRSNYIVYVDPAIMPEPHTYIAFWNNMSPTEYQSLEKGSIVDKAGFTRPTKLGDTLLIQELPSNFTCKQPSDKVVYIAKDNPQFLPAIKTIYSNTNIFQFAYVFEHSCPPLK